MSDHDRYTPEERAAWIKFACALAPSVSSDDAPRIFEITEIACRGADAMLDEYRKRFTNNPITKGY